MVSQNNIKKTVSRTTVRWVTAGIIILFGFSFTFVFPDLWNQAVDGIEQKTGMAIPKVNQSQPFVLGLDLKGGAYLEYEADVSAVELHEQRDAVHGVRDVIERRVNALGVSEPSVQTNKSGENWRIIVELAGVSEIQEAIDAIGETPVLEFKELSDEPLRELTDEEKQELEEINTGQRERAEELLKKITSGESFEDIASANSEDHRSRDNGGLMGFVRAEGVFTSLIEPLKNKPEGYLAPAIIENEEGLNIVRLNGVDTQGEEQGYAHMLFCHSESTQGCPVERTKEDARSSAEGAYNAIINRNETVNKDTMQALADEFANDGGDLGYFSAGQLFPELEEVAVNLPLNTLSTPVESPFGYHLLYTYDRRNFTQYNISRILISTATENDILPQNERWKSTGLSGAQLERADLVFDPNTGSAEVQVQFNDLGRQLFADLTERNIGNLLAIFLDGEPISIPQVQQVIPHGTAVISGNFTPESARLLAQRLNAGALPLPIELVRQSTVGASLGSETLEKSVKAGIIGLVIVMIFMIAYYRLPGIIASISLILYTLLVLAVFKMVPVTLTAAAIAGFVLSLGMAIDANILIFERMREEMKEGKSLSVAMEEGFNKAWFAIKASNVSSAITAVILIYLSTSIVKGFAFTLLIGIAMSVFTAVTCTRYLMRFIIPFTKATPWLYLGTTNRK